MQLKLRIGGGHHVDDVIVDAAATATVGDLAAVLVGRLDATPGERADPDRFGLAVFPATGEPWVLAPGNRLDGAGLTCGDAVEPTESVLAEAPSVPAVTVQQTGGLGAPSRIDLPTGRATIGRSPDRDVCLSDPMVSKLHAHLRVGDVVEIIDAGSANGVLLNGRRIDRAILHPTDEITVGESTFSVRRISAGPTAPNTDGRILHHRSPRVDANYVGPVLTAPEPPKPPTSNRFPIASVLAPIALAGVLFLFTQNLLSILFFALSPVLMIGSWWENRSANRRQVVTETATFRQNLADLRTQLEYAQHLEQLGRRAEFPSSAELLDAINERSPLVWTRRPEHDKFGQLRLGLGTLASRTSVEMPQVNATLPGLWQELTDTVGAFVTVDRVPVTTDLRSCGSIGICGPEIAAAPVWRGVMNQIVALHAPGEVDIAVLAPPTASWEWLSWIPHTSTEWTAGDAVECAEVTARIEQLVADRVDQSDAGPSGTTNDSTNDRALTLPLMVVAVHDRAPIDRARLVQLAEHGPAVGVHLVWYADAIDRLPAACRTFVDVDANAGTGRVGLVREELLVEPIELDALGAGATEHAARRLSPLVDSGASSDALADLPASVSLSSLVGDELAVRPDAVVDRWRLGAADAGLRAIVGRTGDGPMHLDLRSQGPHALVGGTTGAGKSEFLQAWILGLALDHAPTDVNVLLVDYKGGAAFGDCVRLPHCVGLVTDLDPLLVRRALASLDAELRYREQLLHDRGAKDLAALRERDDPDCPPSLVIVVDEFAALVNEIPEFLDGMVNIAQRGRSLGLHLIVATQRPAGVINDNLRANTNLRVALRMADESDSVDVIGAKDAAWFDPDIPGRAAVATGAGRLSPFQGAYAGGRHVGQHNTESVAVASLRLGHPAPWPTLQSSTVMATGPTDVERFVATITDAAVQAEFDAPRQPWLPPLEPLVTLDELVTDAGEGEIVFGRADDPAHQTQPLVAFRPDVDGALAIVGIGGSGTSTTLRSIAISAPLSDPNYDTWVYGLDFGAHALRPLIGLPHVGDVVPGDDPERVRRLLVMLEEILDDRSHRFAQRQASSISEYRQRVPDADDARILVLVDGIGTFREEYEGGRDHRWWQVLIRLATEGRALGLHLVITADRPASMSSQLASAISRQVVLRIASEIDLGGLDVPNDAFGPGTPAGRGFVDGLEVQVGVVGGSSDLVVQTAAASALLQHLHLRSAPPQIRNLPEHITLAELDTPGAYAIDDDELGPVQVPVGAPLVVAGPPGSGVTTAITTIVRTLLASTSEPEAVLFAARRSSLATAVPWVASATGPADVAELAARLADHLPASSGEVVVVIDGVGELVDSPAADELLRALDGCRDRSATVIASGEPSSLAGSWPLLQAVKSHRRGLVLQPDQMDGEMLFKTAFPRVQPTEFPAGRGLAVANGRVTKVHVAVPA